jgi:ComF family protein
MATEPAFAGARSAFLHAGPAQRLVVEFKSGGQPVLASLMAALARPAFRELVSSLHAPERAVVTWVPSHRAAQRRRGYNQAELLARALAAERPALAKAELVHKTVRTKHQKELDRAGRQANLRGAFAFDTKAIASLPFHPSAVLLVDDVYTTGATAHEVSAVLQAHAGLPVYVFTFSRAVSRRRQGHD